MIPWAIYAVFMGDYKRAIMLVVIYAITQIVRQLIQPKLVGDSVGLNPLVTLLLIYIGLLNWWCDLDDPCCSGWYGHYKYVSGRCV